MTSWYPGNGDRDGDVLDHGDGAPAARPIWLVVAALVLLAFGAVLGSRMHDTLPWVRPADAAPQPHLVGGTIEPASGTAGWHSYRLSLFNPGEETITARIVGLNGYSVNVPDSRPVQIAPGDWEDVTFALPRECGSPAVPIATDVEIRTARNEEDQQVPLSAPTRVLRENRERECSQPTALRPRDLGGLWFLEEVEGRWTDLAGVGLMRFDADGSFAFDPEGHLFQEGRQGMLGAYRLQGTRLLLQTSGGYACGKGYHEVWTTTRLAKNLLRLDIVRSDPGYCYTPPGEREILRRLVAEDALPAKEPVRRMP